MYVQPLIATTHGIFLKIVLSTSLCRFRSDLQRRFLSIKYQKMNFMESNTYIYLSPYIES